MEIYIFGESSGRNCRPILVYLHLPHYREQNTKPLDIVGLILFGSGVALLSYVLEIFGEHALSTGEIVGLLAISLAHATRIAFPLLSAETTLKIAATRRHLGARIGFMSVSSSFSGAIGAACPFGTTPHGWGEGVPHGAATAAAQVLGRIEEARCAGRFQLPRRPSYRRDVESG
jgi:hypothetical protein